MNNTDLNQKNIIKDILDIIEYKDENDKFTEKFSELFFKSIVVILVESLPEVEKKEMATFLESNNIDEEKIKLIFEKNLTPEEIRSVMTTVLFKQLEEWLTKITPNLSLQQKQKLDKYLEDLTLNT